MSITDEQIRNVLTKNVPAHGGALYEVVNDLYQRILALEERYGRTETV